MARASGAMDNAPDYGSGDCRFNSCLARHFLAHSLAIVTDGDRGPLSPWWPAFAWSFSLLAGLPAQQKLPLHQERL